MKGIKSVEEFFLGGFFAGNELDIIDKQNIGSAIFVAEGRSGVSADGVDQVVGKFFG